jgi:hypothetical protein
VDPRGWLRRIGSSSGRSRAHSRTARATVLGEQPASSAASRSLPVRSKVSRISTTSPSDFSASLLGSWVPNNPSEPRGWIAESGQSPWEADTLPAELLPLAAREVMADRARGAEGPAYRSGQVRPL